MIARAKPLNIVLDLDNTLICSVAFRDLGRMPRVRKENLKCIDMDKSFRVFLRPHLQEFLDYIFKNFNVFVWTAASVEYAMFIVESLLLRKPLNGKRLAERAVEGVFFEYHVDLSDKLYGWPKKLAMYWEVFKWPGMSAANTIIVDDLMDVSRAQPSNAIRVIPFDVLKARGSSYKDNELSARVIPRLQAIHRYLIEKSH